MREHRKEFLLRVKEVVKEAVKETLFTPYVIYDLCVIGFLLFSCFVAPESTMLSYFFRIGALALYLAKSHAKRQENDSDKPEDKK